MERDDVLPSDERGENLARGVEPPEDSGFTTGELGEQFGDGLVEVGVRCRLHALTLG